MDLILSIIDFILHIDIHLGEIIAAYGVFSYLILFAIVFAETGLVFMPLLPGDSLLFAAGAFASLGSFNIVYLLATLWIAATVGDTVNYFIGRFFGQRLIEMKRFPLNAKHIAKTEAFFAKHGGKTIFLARFVPIVRTFAPFVAGIGHMDYRYFLLYNLSGATVWVFGFVLLGYFFGNLPSVKDNFSLVILAIIVLSIMPIIFEWIKSRRRMDNGQSEQERSES